MTPEESKEAHDTFKAAITQAFWDFSNKYFGDKSETPEAIAIMKHVLQDCVSAVERQIGRVPFTRHQEDHICFQIGTWYFMMKPLLEGTHNLGRMKEKLKEMICNG